MERSMLASLAMALAGAAIMGAVVIRSRRLSPDLAPFLEGLGYDEPSDRLADPLLSRLLGGAARAVTDRLERLVPANYVEKIDNRLVQAGMSRRAGQQLAIQLLLGAAGLTVGPLLPGGSSLKRTMAVVLLPVMGFILPAARVKRAIKARSDAMFKDLPDIVDMLAISVEAGCGFEAALTLVCKNFNSPLTDELTIALQEMELGLSRKEALQALRARVQLDVVRTLILSLLQADALGMPIGRVLKSQSTEVRARRRSWAREKAAKLPVKIMFPLVLFIFPPILGIVLGPAAGSFSKLGGG